MQLTDRPTSDTRFDIYFTASRVCKRTFQGSDEIGSDIGCCSSANRNPWIAEKGCPSNTSYLRGRIDPALQAGGSALIPPNAKTHAKSLAAGIVPCRNSITTHLARETDYHYAINLHRATTDFETVQRLTLDYPIPA